jgi:hypothetical protein
VSYFRGFYFVTVYCSRSFLILKVPVIWIEREKKAWGHRLYLEESLGINNPTVLQKFKILD